MFGRKKDRAKISDKDPVFNARFIGSIETFVASGKGCTLTSVQHLWDNAGEERHLKKVNMVLGKSGMTMKFTDKKDAVLLFPIENISFCNADKAVNDRIFCWISRVPGTKKLECFAVLCGSKERAQAMALVLSRAFQIAYKDWKSGRNKEDRQKMFKTSDSDSEPTTPVNQLSKTDKAENGEHQSSNGNILSSSSPVLKPGLHHDRKESHDSNSSGFANSNILDPDMEEDMKKDSRVHDAMNGDGTEKL